MEGNPYVAIFMLATMFALSVWPAFLLTAGLSVALYHGGHWILATLVMLPSAWVLGLRLYFQFWG